MKSCENPWKNFFFRYLPILFSSLTTLSFDDFVSSSVTLSSFADFLSFSVTLSSFDDFVSSSMASMTMFISSVLLWILCIFGILLSFSSMMSLVELLGQCGHVRMCSLKYFGPWALKSQCWQGNDHNSSECATSINKYFIFSLLQTFRRFFFFWKYLTFQN